MSKPVTETANAPQAFDDRRFDVLGVPISVTTLQETSAKLIHWSNDSVGRFICVRDVASLMAIRADPLLRELHHDAAMVLPDGMPLVWYGKRLGLPVERTCGPDLMQLVCASSPRTGIKHYFFGGVEGVAEKLRTKFETAYPGIQIMGTDSPPFRSQTVDEEEESLRKIRESGADILWVGMSSPKQDIWMWHNHRKLPQVMIGVGAAFDFHSGRVKRAPKWTDAGGAWLYSRLGGAGGTYNCAIAEQHQMFGLMATALSGALVTPMLAPLLDSQLSLLAASVPASVTALPRGSVRAVL